LPDVATPENYKLRFTPNLEKATFEGEETISIQVLKPTSEITLNSVDIDLPTSPSPAAEPRRRRKLRLRKRRRW
jgi:hypothetical protein